MGASLSPSPRPEKAPSLIVQQTCHSRVFQKLWKPFLFPPCAFSGENSFINSLRSKPVYSLLLSKGFRAQFYRETRTAGLHGPSCPPTLQESREDSRVEQGRERCPASLCLSKVKKQMCGIVLIGSLPCLFVSIFSFLNKTLIQMQENKICIEGNKDNLRFYHPRYLGIYLLYYLWYVSPLIKADTFYFN